MSLIDAFSERRPFPGQDPWVVSHDGSLLLVQSARGNRRIVVKRFRDLQRMDRNVETTIWAPKGHDRRRELWAPELHQVDGCWYLYFAASEAGTAGHRMYVLEAEDPLGPYRDLGKVCDPNHDCWAIDMTVFTHAGRLYAVWSGWDGPDDRFPQNLYIAPMSNPWTISGERRCLSRPELEWEMSVAPVNEGPTVFGHAGSGRLFLVYAADASWTTAYKTGLLEWGGGDVTDPAAWRKSPEHWFADGGHGCVVDTPAGQQFVYHRKLTSEPGWADREIVSTPLLWDTSGYPVIETARTAGSAAPAGGVYDPLGRVG